MLTDHLPDTCFAGQLQACLTQFVITLSEFVGIPRQFQDFLQLTRPVVGWSRLTDGPASRCKQISPSMASPHACAHMAITSTESLVSQKEQEQYQCQQAHMAMEQLISSKRHAAPQYIWQQPQDEYSIRAVFCRASKTWGRVQQSSAKAFESRMKPRKEGNPRSQGKQSW